MKTVVFHYKKGGVGKTSISLNVCAYKALKHKCLYIDIDEQRNSTSTLQKESVRDEHTIYDVLTHKVNIKDAIKESKFNNIDYIPGSLKATGINADKLELKKLFQEIYSQYDYIFIDTPASSNLSTVQSAIVSSDVVVIPSILDSYSSANLMNVVGQVRKLNTNTEIIIAPNRYVKRSKLFNNVLGELKEYLSGKDYVRLVKPLPDSIEITNQIAEDKLLVYSGKSNKLKQAIKKLSREV